MKWKVRGQLWTSWWPSAVARWGVGNRRRGRFCYTVMDPEAPSHCPPLLTHPCSLSWYVSPATVVGTWKCKIKEQKWTMPKQCSLRLPSASFQSDFASNLLSRGGWHYFHMQSFPYPGSLLWLPEIEYQGREASPEIRSIQEERPLWLPTPWDLSSTCSWWWIECVNCVWRRLRPGVKLRGAVQLCFRHQHQPNTGNLQWPCISSRRIWKFSPCFQHPP